MPDAPQALRPGGHFAPALIAAKPGKPCDGSVFRALDWLLHKRAPRPARATGRAWRVLWRPGRNARIGAMKSSAASWVEVVRLRTLPASIAPVLLGTGIAFALGAASWTRALLAWRWLCKRAALRAAHSQCRLPSGSVSGSDCRRNSLERRAAGRAQETRAGLMGARAALFLQEQIQPPRKTPPSHGFRDFAAIKSGAEKPKKSPVWPGFLSFVKGQAACQALRRRSFSPASPARASAPKVSASG